MILVGGRGRLGRDGLVHVRVERDARRLDPRDAQRRELLPHLALDEVHAFVERLRVGRSGVDVREARQVVQRIGEARHEVRLGSDPRLGTFLGRALLVVLVLGGEAEVAVLELVALRLEPHDRLIGGLDGQRNGIGSRGGGRRRGRLRRLRLQSVLLLVGHDLHCVDNRPEVSV